MLYVGGQYVLARQAALHLALTADRLGCVLILSAKHGLLQLDDEIAPYDMTIGDPHAVPPGVVREQAAALIGPATEVVSLLPARYAALLDAAGVTARHVLAGTRGIGDQRARLARIVRTGWAALDE